MTFKRLKRQGLITIVAIQLILLSLTTSKQRQIFEQQKTRQMKAVNKYAIFSRFLTCFRPAIAWAPFGTLKFDIIRLVDVQTIEYN